MTSVVHAVTVSATYLLSVSEYTYCGQVTSARQDGGALDLGEIIHLLQRMNDLREVVSHERQKTHG